MGFLTRRLGEGLVNSCDPLDVLYVQNPEIASIAYANRERLFSPEFMPYIAGFRKLQHDERVAFMGEVTKRLGIESRLLATKSVVDGNVEINRQRENGQTQRTQLLEQGQTQRVQILDQGETRRLGIEADSIRDLQRIKYESRRLMLKDYVDGIKYISDNEALATKTEAEALRDAIIFSEQIKGYSSLEETRVLTVAEVQRAELEYAQKIREAELLRQTEEQGYNTEISVEYIRFQSGLFRDLINLEMQRVMSSCEVSIAFSDLAKNIAEENSRLLIESGRTKVRTKGVVGRIEIDLSTQIGD